MPGRDQHAAFLCRKSGDRAGKDRTLAGGSRVGGVLSGAEGELEKTDAAHLTAHGKRWRQEEITDEGAGSQTGDFR